ncbi:uncharacterized protein SOCE26_015480 [Sorangium cellulosum]|uniref:Uncharacterized protein n=1 Tax=Sorangium cellulosum TaxID=56 RepID=A0A2L0ELH5_SORCE|nr:uncharacterized protein SOCE26_015480 [Sorangium cellulosum]
MEWTRPTLAVGDRLSIRIDRASEHDAPTRRAQGKAHE